MTINRHWKDTIAMGIVFEEQRSKSLREGHSEKYRRIVIDEANRSITETEHELRVRDPESVEEDTFELDTVRGEMVVVDNKVFEGKEAIERRFGVSRDLLYSHQPMVAYGESAFYLTHEPTLAPRAKR